MEKWPFLRLGQEIQKVSLQDLILPEGRKDKTNIQGHSLERHRSQLKSYQSSKPEKFREQNKSDIGFLNPRYKISTYEIVLI